MAASAEPTDGDLLDLDPARLGGFPAEMLYGSEPSFPPLPETSIDLPTNGAAYEVVDHQVLASLRSIASGILPAASHGLAQLQQLRQAEVEVGGRLSGELWERVREAQASAAGLYETAGKILWMLRPGRTS